MPQWSDEELAVLAGMPPRAPRGAIAAFCARFPAHSRSAVVTKLAMLRRRGAAADIGGETVALHKPAAIGQSAAMEEALRRILLAQLASACRNRGLTHR